MGQLQAWEPWRFRDCLDVTESQGHVEEKAVLAPQGMSRRLAA